MNPVLLKPTGERSSQVVVLGRPTGVQSAAEYHRSKRALLPVVLDALADLRRRFDVVICEGAGSPAEINLLDGDIVNLPLARAAGLPAVVVGDIDRGGVFASLYGTVAVLPDGLRSLVRGFIVNKLRGDPSLLGDACAELERRCGVPTLGVLPHVGVDDIDNEDSLALDRAMADTAAVEGSWPAHRGPLGGAVLPAGPGGPGMSAEVDVLDVVALRWPRVSNAGDLDPLRLEPAVRVRWVRSVAELGRPDLVVLPGSKDTRGDLAWFRSTGLAAAVESSDAALVAVCAGLQMVGDRIDDPDGVEGPPGCDRGLGLLPVGTDFRGDKVLDRPAGEAVDGPVPAAGQPVRGYRIHHGRVTATGAATPWLNRHADDQAPGSSGNPARGDPPTPRARADDRPADPPGAGEPDGTGGWPASAGTGARPGDRPAAAAGGEVLGWHAGRVVGTTLHGLFENDGLRAGVLRWAAERAGKRWSPSGLDFAAHRLARLDRMADAVENHLDLDRLRALIAEGAP
jgi:adenosylcobyric acid synthase